MITTIVCVKDGCSGNIFYLESHSKIFEAIRSLYLNDTPVDVTSLTTYLISIEKINEVGGVEYINEVVNSVMKLNKKPLLAIIPFFPYNSATCRQKHP